ncbi:hypothetical protein OEZ86_009950 [Tetradesmus obliquus]|nr:hypothetical protein OEZ86_009950 [Tetradesmus obliquus]
MDLHDITPAGSADAHAAAARDQQQHLSTINEEEKSYLLQQRLHQQHHSLQDEFQEAAAAAQRYIVHHHRVLTTFLVAISRVLENTDASLLPAVYLYVGCAFSASPAQLGAMTFSRLLAQALASPAGGLLGHKLNRARLVAVTCWYWALMTTLFACSSATWQGSVLWALNGLGLGVMVPNAQSLIADYYDATHRGRAFGMLLAVGE